MCLFGPLLAQCRHTRFIVHEAYVGMLISMPYWRVGRTCIACLIELRTKLTEHEFINSVCAPNLCTLCSLVLAVLDSLLISL